MVLFKIYSFSKVPRLFCGPFSEMMVNCFACGKDIGVSTERRSFSGERSSESKVRVLPDSTTISLVPRLAARIIISFMQARTLTTALVVVKSAQTAISTPSKPSTCKHGGHEIYSSYKFSYSEIVWTTFYAESY